MGYSATTEVILYCNPDQPFEIQSDHHVWFDKYDYRLSIYGKHIPGYLLLPQYPEIIIHNSDLLNLIPCELDITLTPFCDTPILTYKTDLTPAGNTIGFNLLDGGYFKIPYATDTIPN